MPKADAKPTGRPKFELTPENLEHMKSLAGFGLSLEKIAQFFGTSLRTIQRRQKDTEAVKVALDQGRALAEASISRSLYEQATGGNVSAIIWFVKTRCGRVETKAMSIAREETERALVQFFGYLQGIVPEEQFQSIMTQYQNYLAEAEQKAAVRVSARD